MPTIIALKATLILTGGFLLICPPFAVGAENVSTEPDAYQSLVREFEAAQAAWSEQFSGDLDEARTIERYDTWPSWSFIPRFAALAEAQPNEPFAVDNLGWIVAQSRRVGVADRELLPYDNRAIDTLKDRYLNDPRIDDTFLTISRYPTPAREALLRACMDQADSREVRGLACLALAELLSSKVEIASKLWFDEPVDDPFRKHIADRMAPEYKEYARAMQAAQDHREALKMYQRTIDDFGDVTYPREVPLIKSKPKLAAVARYRLHQLDAVAIGTRAPELAGQTIEGKPLKLSDYQGKVVVVSFWASWCAPCIEKIPRYQTLAKRLEGKPFALIGVNFDEDRDAAQKLYQDMDVPWPSLWALGGDESIGRWHVDRALLPAVFIVDHRGIIRFRDVEGKQLDEAVDQLLAEIREQRDEAN